MTSGKWTQVHKIMKIHIWKVQIHPLSDKNNRKSTGNKLDNLYLPCNWENKSIQEWKWQIQNGAKSVSRLLSWNFRNFPHPNDWNRRVTMRNSLLSCCQSWNMKSASSESDFYRRFPIRVSFLKAMGPIPGPQTQSLEWVRRKFFKKISGDSPSLSDGVGLDIPSALSSSPGSP